MKKTHSKLNSKYTPMNIVACFVMMIFAIIILFPLFWAFFSSFKTRLDWIDNKLGFPSADFGWRFKNYEEALTRMFVLLKTDEGTKKIYMWRQAINSVLYAGSFTFVTIFMHSLVAYVVSKYNFKFCKIIYGIVLVTLMLPIVGSMSSGLQVRQMLGIDGTFIGELLIAAGGFGGMQFLIFYACFKAIPWSYAEAAQMDGAGHFMIFIRIMMPLAWSTVSACSILSFIGLWNNYQTPLVYMPNMPTLAVGLFMFKEAKDEYSSVPNSFAATMIISVPTLVLFVLFRNKIMGNIAVGGLKG